MSDLKDLYEIGEIPPLGHVPAKMYAWAIRRERHGEPEKSFQLEVVETPTLDSHDVLIMVMAVPAMSMGRETGEPWKLAPDSCMFSSGKNIGLSPTPFNSISTCERA